MKVVCLLFLALTLVVPAFANPRGDMLVMRGGHKPVMNLKIGDPVRDFEITDIGGAVIKIEGLRKGKVLVVRFSQIEDRLIPSQIEILNEMNDKFKEKMVIVDVIDKNAKPEQVVEIYEKWRSSFTPSIDSENKVIESYALKSMPAILVFDLNGKLLFASMHAPNWIFKEAITRALKIENAEEIKPKQK